MKFGTKTIHSGIKPDMTTGSVMTPIYQTSTYVQNAPGDHQGYEYARTKNPTREVLEKSLAAIENGKYGIAFGSGLAAVDAVMKLLKVGDEVVSVNDLYSGTFRLMTKIFGKFGIKSKFVDLKEAGSLHKHITKDTKIIWIETPTNPMLNIVDIKAICKIAKKKKVLTLVDNTFASPYLQNPLDLGADLVLHSATKYLGGHSDVILGAVITKSKKLADELYFIQNASGAIPGPNDCFLVLRGIKTLHIRVERACKNAKKVANFLVNHPKVKNVYYPGLKTHPNHKVAKKQMRMYGAMLSFDLKGDKIEDGLKVLQNTKLFWLAESLGGVESLISQPASMTHNSIPRRQRLSVGLTDTLIRLSVGIEDVRDLIKDLDQALDF